MKLSSAGIVRLTIHELASRRQLFLDCLLRAESQKPAMGWLGRQGSNLG